QTSERGRSIAIFRLLAASQIVEGRPKHAPDRAWHARPPIAVDHQARHRLPAAKASYARLFRIDREPLRRDEAPHHAEQGPESRLALEVDRQAERQVVRVARVTPA